MLKKWALVKLLVGFILSFTLLSTHVNAQCTVPGWASQNGGVTGGGSATPTVVNTYAALKTALTTASVKVVHVQGTITFPTSGRISIQDQSGKSIIGLPGSKLVSVDMTADGSGIFYVKRCSNILFKNLHFEGPGAYDTDGNDNMTIDGCTNVWVDHCEFHDAVDGNLDIKNAADLISITWCKFSYEKAPKAGGSGGADDHRYSNLFGSSDGATGDRGKLRITMQYCWWAEGCRERMPRIRFGKIHMVNNLFSSSVSNHCIRAGFEADILAEGNYFQNQKLPIDKYENNFTAIKAVNNFGASDITSGTAFTPPYSITVAAPANIVSPIQSCAGAKLSSPTSCGCGSTVNTPPSVSLTAPSNNASFTAPASISISVNAADSDGSVSNVQFYSGSTLLGSDASSPYSFAWTNVAAGTYTITAKATDNAGATTTSSAITVVVSNAANTPPTVSLTAPSNNASYTAPASITISANAADANGTVSNVQFYNGSTLLGSDASSPYSFAWTNVAAGTYTITAKATDNSGATTTSSAITVVVNNPANTAPTVSITAPSNNASFTAPASITISANAADANGTVSNVQFYNGSTLLGSDASSPYSFAWTNVAAGAYTITAKATDNAGATTTSSAVTVVVNAVQASVTVQAETACTADGILNETVNAGYHGSGYVNLNNVVGTSASWVVNSSASQTVSLKIRFANASANSRNMSLSVNGAVQVASVPFPSTGAWTTWNTATVQVNLATGRNTLLLKSLTSEGAPNIDELTFASSSVSAASCVAPNQSPSVGLSSPSNNASFTAPASISITANASDVDGTVSSVQFFSGSTLLGSDGTSPYTITWANVAAGTYSITAVATDNQGATTTSSAVAIVVNNPALPATITKHGSGSATQTVAEGASISTFNYTWTNATTVTVTGLPAGLNAAIDNAEKNVVISGAPTQSGTYEFTVTTVGGNPNASRGGTITVTESATKMGAFNSVAMSSVAPNPSAQSFLVTLKEPAKLVRVYSLTGVQLYQFENVDTDLSFGNELTHGLYVVIIEYTNGKTESIKVQKN